MACTLSLYSISILLWDDLDPELMFWLLSSEIAKRNKVYIKIATNPTIPIKWCGVICIHFNLTNEKLDIWYGTSHSCCDIRNRSRDTQLPPFCFWVWLNVLWAVRQQVWHIWNTHTSSNIELMYQVHRSDTFKVDSKSLCERMGFWRVIKFGQKNEMLTFRKFHFLYILYHWN